ncbi:BlaI/MecI/CopY family transcriptional regulator [Danxiaibacter flavus]|uniref:BlaI/MecI/CopY family transcriptional regulator n=1 Tax=Danxiaibacter flavus TaxID=3049108 RepID=A0ABV3ZK79_9BACT|nr:BlaI/MecI/CopY family transcriptional regulator [Chitinophagaceae bacterium DXS]
MKQKNQSTVADPVPAKSEMDVLQILWQHGPSTVRFVHDILTEKKGNIQYTSTLKLMQTMTEKGLLMRDETNMKHIYSAVLEEKKTKGNALSKFLDNMYEGSVKSLMTALLGNEKTSPEELKVLEEMLHKLDKTK